MQKIDFVPEGKTKILEEVEPFTLEVTSKDDLTAGNGARHDLLPGKAELANATTCNVFDLLQRRGIPLAYIRRSGPKSFLAHKCQMIKLEVVVRSIVAPGSSILKRRPDFKAGNRFPAPVVEFYLKTTGRRWVSSTGEVYELPVDDPYLVYKPQGFLVFHPAKPTEEQEPLFTLPLSELCIMLEDLEFIGTQAIRSFVILADAWEKVAGALLQDFKVEFGWYWHPLIERPSLLMADVIDNDGWRLLIDGEEKSKERYRQGAPLEEVLANYKLVAELTEKFATL